MVLTLVELHLVEVVLLVKVMQVVMEKMFMLLEQVAVVEEPVLLDKQVKQMVEEQAVMVLLILLFLQVKLVRLQLEK